MPSSARFVALGASYNAKGRLQVLELDGLGCRSLCEVGHPSGLRCSSFGATARTDRQLATGSADGELLLWALERTEAGPAWTAAGAHAGGVACLDGVGARTSGAHGAPELATGGVDGVLKVWDVRQRDAPVASFQPPAAAEAESPAGPGGRRAVECWSVSFGDSHGAVDRVVAAGYSTGAVRLFDLRAGRLRWETSCPSAVCGLEFDRREAGLNKLVAACLEGAFRVWDVSTQHPTRGMACCAGSTGESATLWTARHLPHNRDVWALTDGTGCVRLYRYHYPEKRREKVEEDGGWAGLPGTCELLCAEQLSQQPLTSWDWSAEKRGLGLCTSVDQCIRVVTVTGLE